MSDLLAPVTFTSLSHLLDPRILRALADFKFLHPTLVQAKAIPLALEGKDILAKARTGSGKTGAYCIPTLQKVLAAKAAIELSDSARQQTRALILVPTRELAEQVTNHLKGLTAYCDKEVLVANVAGGASTQLQTLLMSDRPDIVIATPSRALSLLQSKTLSLASLETLTIDEADLILSYGHSDDVKQIFSGGYMPKVYQSFLMSATLTKDVEILKGMVLRNPAILRLEEDTAASSSLLTQYYVKCSEPDKFLLAYVLLKLRLIKGKCILFVNDVDRSYRLKLFLEQFGVKACVLNAELPLNSRFHIVQEFNKGVYDYIIATDEAGLEGNAEEDDSEEEEEEEEVEVVAKPKHQLISTQPAAPRSGTSPEPASDDNDNAASTSTSTNKRPLSPPPTTQPSKRARKAAASSSKQDKEYGISRGIDFVSVSCVLNFDLPTTVRSYTHRVGRTARAHEAGLAISFVVPSEEWGKDKAVSLPSARRDEPVFERIKAEVGGVGGGEIKEWEWGGRRGEVEGFRYRMEDALRSVTGKTVKDARREEVRRELLNSEKLKAHFALNPMDLSFLRHDAPLHPTRVQTHMKHVPGYLMPRISAIPGSSASADASSSSAATLEAAAAAGASGGGEMIVPFGKVGGRGRGGKGGRGGRGGRGGSRGGRGGAAGGGGGPKKKDPLKNFK